MSKYVLDKDKTRAQALDSRRKGMEAVVTQLLKDYDMSLREFYDAYLYSIASLAVQGQELVARALVAEYEKIKTIYHSENEKFCETLLGWEGETGNKKIRRYHKDTCLAVCPYFLEDNNIRVPSIRRAVLCSFSGQLKELVYKGAHVLRTSECKATPPTVMEITRTTTIKVDEEDPTQCSDECPYLRCDEHARDGEYYCLFFGAELEWLLQGRTPACRESFGLGDEE